MDDPASFPSRKFLRVKRFAGSDCVCSDKGKIASALPISQTTCFESIRCTLTVYTSPSLSAYSSYTSSLSASRSLCSTTCLAVRAAILPALAGSYS